MANIIQFYLDGCDICFVAEAPEDITLKQLLEQTDKIFPDYCACGIVSMEKKKLDFAKAYDKTEIFIDYDSIRADDSAACSIVEDWREHIKRENEGGLN